jgi:hypothetical protein
MSQMSQAIAPEISPRLTNACASFCLVVAAAMPILVVVSWATSPTPQYWAQDIGAEPAQHLRPLGAALATIPSLLLARGLFLAHRCLRRFGRSEFFTPGAIADLKGFARWSFFASVAGVLATTVIGLALTILNPTGPRELTISVEPQDLVGLLLSGIFWIMAGVLARAAQVADENRQFV